MRALIRAVARLICQLRWTGANAWAYRSGTGTTQAYAQEQKNQVNDKILVPVPFATYALAKIAAQIGSKLETVGKTVSRRHPEIDPRILETLEREIAMARNITAQFGDDLPGILDEYLATMDH